jgi:hypothetical protein
MEERAGERRRVCGLKLECPSPRSSPHSSVVGRGRKILAAHDDSVAGQRPKDAEMNENEISKIIVDSAIEVHRELGGPGLIESVYGIRRVVNGL